jgi:hypothetical protein
VSVDRSLPALLSTNAGQPSVLKEIGSEFPSLGSTRLPALSGHAPALDSAQTPRGRGHVFHKKVGNQQEDFSTPAKPGRVRRMFSGNAFHALRGSYLVRRWFQEKIRLRPNIKKAEAGRNGSRSAALARVNDNHIRWRSALRPSRTGVAVATVALATGLPVDFQLAGLSSGGLNRNGARLEYHRAHDGSNCDHKVRVLG